MIEFTRAYVANGQTFATLVEAQVAEIRALLADAEIPAADLPGVADAIVENGPAIVSILTTTNKSRPRARKENGGRKQRKSAPVTEPALEI